MKNQRVFLLGAAALVLGLACAFLDLWNWVEPTLGMGSLLFSGMAFLEAQRANHAIQQVGDHMPLKSFAVTFGLREGYDADAPSNSISEVEDLIHQWMVNRANLGLQVVTGMTQSTTLLYPVRNNDENGTRVTREPTCQYVGTLSAKYDKEYSDADTIETLSDLARWVGERTNQKRVYITYCDQQWVVDIEK